MYYNEFHLVVGQDKIAQCNLNKTMFAWWMADLFNICFLLYARQPCTPQLEQTQPPSHLLMDGGRWASCSAIQCDLWKMQEIKVAPQTATRQRLITLPDSLWTIMGHLTATCAFLKSRAGIHHLVTSQKQLHVPKQGTGPREVAFPSTDNLQKMGSPLRPPVLTVSCPQERVQWWECPCYLGLSSLW